ncbi:hypothetical protein, partial [Streptococcus pneumoniae]|uniref:hypothetical protein n=1 Tax=Streptococcus pneumoniae TaxID=1313 RepID=UPI001E545484
FTNNPGLLVNVRKTLPDPEGLNPANQNMNDPVRATLGFREDNNSAFLIQHIGYPNAARILGNGETFSPYRITTTLAGITAASFSV